MQFANSQNVISNQLISFCAVYISNSAKRWGSDQFTRVVLGGRVYCSVRVPLLIKWYRSKTMNSITPKVHTGTGCLAEIGLYYSCVNIRLYY